ncbi:hypothetical protein H2200_005972 [Cladophialophora chaetospira]|uniref:Uncharacterized protein n=1 Tax=Cladophialophora chaetospira TaxID=386627 RepID=A0AA39CIP0_9EURO|nr:hypothetical protein H2200_005972 [Cladophialophora chaetospira]
MAAPTEVFEDTPESDEAVDHFEDSLNSLVKTQLNDDNSRNSFSAQDRTRVKNLYHPESVVKAEAKLAREHRDEAEKIHALLIKKIRLKNMKNGAKQSNVKFSHDAYISKKIKERLHEVEGEMDRTGRQCLDREREVDSVLWYMEAHIKCRFWSAWGEEFAKMRDSGVKMVHKVLKENLPLTKSDDCNECVANG